MGIRDVLNQKQTPGASPPGGVPLTPKPDEEDLFSDDAPEQESVGFSRPNFREVVGDSQQVLSEATSNPHFPKYLSTAILIIGIIASYSISHGGTINNVPNDEEVFTAVAQSQNFNQRYGNLSVNPTANSAQSSQPNASNIQLDVADIKVGSCKSVSGGDKEALWKCDITYTYADTTGQRKADSEAVVISKHDSVKDGGDGAVVCKEDCTKAWMFTNEKADDSYDGKQYVHFPHVVEKSADLSGGEA